MVDIDELRRMENGLQSSKSDIRFAFNEALADGGNMNGDAGAIIHTEGHAYDLINATQCIQELRGELATLRAADKWLDIADAPRDGAKIVIAYSIKDIDGESEIIETTLAHWQNWTLKGRVVAGVWVGDDDTIYPSATHYRPLPAPPTGGEHG